MNHVFLAAAIFAAVTTTGTTSQSVEPEVDEGGYVDVGGEGVFAVVNCCDVDTNIVNQSVARLKKCLLIMTKGVTGRWSLQTATSNLKAVDATAAVFIVKDKSLPMSLIAMEAKWGVVNAEGLDQSNLVKEIMRVSTVVLGGASSKYQTSLMKPVFSASDLKSAGDLFTIDSIMLIFPNLGAHGFKQFQSMTFRQACEDGYNPTPSNDIQRKISAEFKK